MNKKNRYMLQRGLLRKNGYDWWWHSFTGKNPDTNEERSFFIEYYIINPGLEKDKPTFGYHGEKPCYAMIKAGSWGKDKKQIHNMYPVKDFTYQNNPFQVTIKDNVLTNHYLKGSVSLSTEEKELHPEYMSDDGSMSWDLSINKNHTFDVGLGANKFFSHLGVFKMFWHAEGVKSSYEGYVVYQGTKYIVTKEWSYGYQDKNWGSDYTNPWLWLNCSNLKLEGSSETLKDTFFDFGGGRPVVLGVSLEGRILGVFSHNNKTYEYNFSKPHLRTKESFDVYEKDEYIYWDIIVENFESKCEINFKAKKDDLLFVKYENPKGKVNHTNLYNGGNAFGTVKLYKKDKKNITLIHTFTGSNGGCEYGIY